MYLARKRKCDESFFSLTLINRASKLSRVDARISSGFHVILGCTYGETNDTFAVDLAIGTGITQVKLGGFRSLEGIKEYNRLALLESAQGSSLYFAGNEFRNCTVKYEIEI